MANEATINFFMSILKGALKYRPAGVSFRADVTGTKGPVPGALTVDENGVNVDLSELTTPGLCIIRNLSSSYYVTYGISDGVEFYPLGEVLPGEAYPMRLSRFLGQSIDDGGSGTGTYDVGTYTLRLRSHGGDAVAVVEAFEA